MQKRIPVSEALDGTGLKKRYIAEKLGVTPQWLSSYLSNPHEISIENALVISELTGKKLSELDFGVPNQKFLD